MTEVPMSRQDLARLSVEDMAQMWAEGRGDALTRAAQHDNPEPVEPEQAPDGQYSREDLKAMTADQIDQARRDGALNWIMGVQS